MRSPEVIGSKELNAFFASIQAQYNPLPDGSFAAVLRDEKGEIEAITAVYPLFAAGGSWVRADLRHKGLSKITRQRIENMLRDRGEQLYVSFPRNEEEKTIFESYGGHVEVREAQVKGL